MPNEAIVKYLEENKGAFSREVLLEQLKQSGYPEADIMAGITAVYGGDMSGIPVALTAPLRYAGFWIRFAAIFIDGILIGLVFAPFKFMVQDFAVGSAILSVIQMPVIWAYNVLMLHYNDGATLGKMALGLRVVADDGNRPTLGKIILRETLGKLASAFTLLIGYMMAGFTQRKQALHDMIAGTVVVRTR
jgi:uncharacterized RDD family membrane protein YckC